jgi:hypothetical protein
MRKGSLAELKAIFYFLIEWEFSRRGKKERKEDLEIHSRRKLLYDILKIRFCCSLEMHKNLLFLLSLQTRIYCRESEKEGANGSTSSRDLGLSCQKTVARKFSCIR